ncbi:glioma pathogenesis-related protein 1-like isoform X2 [Accipiter gentilis]|uniref:glioma pathogenesis-related protein 1-like isoform X2 n=1 Tax=Astur gentilis TaxID=8957 RepID=UPI00210FDB6D|nr:glioma pathogenesis-related protein 1-like isoform X2 [Accipiter gentilis]
MPRAMPAWDGEGPVIRSFTILRDAAVCGWLRKQPLLCRCTGNTLRSLRVVPSSRSWHQTGTNRKGQASPSELAEARACFSSSPVPPGSFHGSQIVWATSYKVGCAVHFCPRVAYSSITNAAHFICNYGPAGNYPGRPYKTGAACSDCSGERCAGKLCQNAERDKVISDSRWRPDWDRPACDEYCITIIALRPLLLILTILATWLLPKYRSVAPASE